MKPPILQFTREGTVANFREIDAWADANVPLWHSANTAARIHGMTPFERYEYLCCTLVLAHAVEPVEPALFYENELTVARSSPPDLKPFPLELREALFGKAPSFVDPLGKFTEKPAAVLPEIVPPCPNCHIPLEDWTTQEVATWGETEHGCPKCNYTWRGELRPQKPAAVLPDDHQTHVDAYEGHLADRVSDEHLARLRKQLDSRVGPGLLIGLALFAALVSVWAFAAGHYVTCGLSTALVIASFALAIRKPV